MRRLLLVVYIVTIALIAVSHVLLPEEVAIHFDGSGQADNWAPRWLNSVLFLAVNSLLFVVCYFGPGLSFAVPKEMINLPNKEYWLAEEHLPEARRILENLLYEFGIALLAFFGTMVALTMHANFSEPVRLDMSLLTVLLVVFLVYSLAWCVRIVTAFRLPKNR